MTFLKRHAYFFVFFGALYLLFFWPLLTFKSSLLRGDYELQVYPWMHAYAEALKAGYLPLWTPFIQSGFPLFAEGQTAMLYLPNLILFKFFPFKIAYNLLFLLHYLAGGIFMYLFALKKKMSHEAAALVAIVFTFGSISAGGFYGVFTLRPLIWFPLALYLVDCFLESGELLPLFILALTQGEAWLGGYPQIAAYGFLFIVLYYFLRYFEIGRSGMPFPARGPVLFFLSLVLSFLIALPQIWGTLELSAHSTRLLQDKSFVLWGSLAPWSLACFFLYPLGMFFQCSLYLGIFPLLLVLTAGVKKDFRLWWALAGTAFFLSLGIFNPLYWLLMLFPAASLLRNPSKFSFFMLFFLTITAGLACDELKKRLFENDKKYLRGFFKKTAKTVSAIFIFFVSTAVVVSAAPGVLLHFGEWYAWRFVIGKSFHHGSPEAYLDKIHAALGLLAAQLNMRSFSFWQPFIFSAAFIALIFFAAPRKNHRFFSASVLLVLALDLFIYGKLSSGTSFVGNISDFKSLQEPDRLPRDGRWLDLLPDGKRIFPPNRNLLTGHAQIGAYSPLLDKDYYLLTKDFGALDDSFGRTKLKIDALGEKRSLLNFLNVKYIVCDFDLKGFRRLFSKQGERRIYLNEEAPGGEFSFESVKNSFSEIHEIQSKPLESLLRVESADGGLLRRNQIFDKGWKVRLDKRKTNLERTLEAFQAVRVPKGGHELLFVYEPDYFMLGRWVHGLGLLIAAGGIIILLIQNPRRAP